MQSIRSKDTLPELMLAQELKRRKIYFAKHVKSLPGNPDFVFRRKRIAVFVDSDFWHGHRIRGHIPKSNLDYWREKIRRNRRRDATVTKELKAKGWTVIRFWEHSLKKHSKRSINKMLKALQ